MQEQRYTSRQAPRHVTLHSHCSAAERLSRSFLAGGVPPGGVSPEGRSLGGEATKAYERLVWALPGKGVAWPG